jgi:hypothetical protein
MLLNGTAQIKENSNTTSGKTEKLDFQATEHASLLTIALPCGFLVSAVL